MKYYFRWLSIAALLAGAWIILQTPPGFGVEPRGPEGLYALLKPNQRIDSGSLDIPNADGISVRTSWESIEPSEGSYDWSYLDETVARAKAAGKKVILRILPGIHSPAWALSGADTITFTVDKAGNRLRGQTLAIPVPWDPVYLKRWTVFVSALGERFGENSSVVLIQMAGPTANTGEMHLPKTPRARALWSQKGYSREKLSGAWKTVIDAYAKAFPEKHLAIDIATPLYNDGTLEEILSYGTERLAARFCVQGNWLHGNTRREFPLYLLVRQYSRTGPVGFQMRAPFRNNPGRDRSSLNRSGGNFRPALETGLAAGARYFEIYYDDFFDPKLSGDMKYASGRIASSD